MKTTLIELDTIPGEQELLILLGNNIFTCYQSVCEAIVLLFSPDIELWDNAGRRGKYFHGYRIKRRSMLVDFYLNSVDGKGLCYSEFHVTKRCFEKIRKQMNTFCPKVKECIMDAIEYEKSHRGGYLSLIVNGDTLQDVLKIVTILS